MIYGYARVSTEGQCLDRQIDQLTAAGVDKENIYTEKMSGTKSNRPKLKALLEVVESGDIVYIESLNRLGRSSADLISIMQTLADEGVTLISIKRAIRLFKCCRQDDSTIPCNPRGIRTQLHCRTC